MIVVKAISGEGYDLLADAESGKKLVLSNGLSEISIPVSDEALVDVLRLHREDMGNTKADTSPRNLAPESGRHPDYEIPMTKVNEYRAEPKHVPSQEFDTGEEYADGASGVGSL